MRFHPLGAFDDFTVLNLPNNKKESNKKIS